MKNVYLESFEIDLADICKYAHQCYEHGERDFAYYENLYYYLQPLYLAKNLQPFLTPETAKKGNNGQQYYESYYYDILPARNRGEFIYFFEVDGCFYDMRTSTPVNRNDINPLDYQKLFALKLSQYSEGLIRLTDFLGFHLSISFNNNQREYFDFLKLTLTQFGEVIGKNVIDRVNYLITSGDQLPKWQETEDSRNAPANLKKLNNLLDGSNKSKNIEAITADNFQNNIPKSGQAKSYEKIETKKVSEQLELAQLTQFVENEVPQGYQIIDGNLTKAEILRYFSFLYLEKSANEKPFLPMEAVLDIFKYGIAIPPPDITITRYRLNLSRNFPKSIIYFAIYRFFSIYTYENKSKKDIVRFFASYLADFSSRLKSEQALDNFASNITNQEPDKIGFDIYDYYPEKLK